jgi:hypothetical protein
MMDLVALAPTLQLADAFYTGRGELIGALVLILDIVAIVSVLAGRSSPAHKLLWTLLILILPVLGMILYYLFGRSSADA